MQTRSLEIKRKIYVLISVFVFAALLASMYSINNKSTDRRSRASQSTILTKDITVTIDFSKPLTKSNFTTGITLANNSLLYKWGANDDAAVTHVRNLIQDGIGVVNQNIIGWGALDPWPDPSLHEPTKWESLDKQMQAITDTGATPMLTLASAPWWMKGYTDKDGKTILLKENDEWSETGLSSRILDNKIDAWLTLVDKVVSRYIVAPYNVRDFQIWRQMKGYFNEQTKKYDFTDFPGNGGANPTHGYTYLYNKTYQRIRDAAAKIGVPTNEIRIGGPALLLNSTSTNTTSAVHGAWGGFDQNELDALQYWLQKKSGADFVSIGGNNFSKDYKENVDDFKVLDKFTELVVWINSKTNTSLPILWSEWYLIPTSLERTSEIKNTLAAYFCVNQIKAGSGGMLSWNDYTEKPQLWSQVTAQGGKATPWYSTYAYFFNNFGPGTEIYSYTASADDLVALISKQKALLINTKSYALRIKIHNQEVTIQRYGVAFLDIKS